MEYESKAIFKEFNIPVPENILIEPDDDLTEKLNKFNFPAIVKSQIAIGSRKKEGLIKIARTKSDARDLCKLFFDKKNGIKKVEAILIEELVDIQAEFYCAVALDASSRVFYLIASKEGGTDIEQVAKQNPEAILKEPIHISKGLSIINAEKLAGRLNLTRHLKNHAVNIFLKLWDITIKREASLVEINPLVVSSDKLIAVDGKMIMDDNAAFRQPLIRNYQERKLTKLQKKAKKAGFSFVELDGDIGILANGAGLTMALLDVLSKMNLKPANFLDVGGGASKERVYKALELFAKMQLKCVFINIYGGITRCDVVAEAIIQALDDFQEFPPLVIRLIGTNDKEGLKILKENGINAFEHVKDAISQIQKIIRT